MKSPQSAQIQRWLRPVSQRFGRLHADEGQKNPKRLEETIEASVVVLAVFAWIAAMTLLP